MSTNETGWSDPKETKAKNLAPYSNNSVACMYWAEGYLKGIEQIDAMATDLAAKDAEIERLKALCLKQFDDMMDDARKQGATEEIIAARRPQYIKENNL